MILGITGAFGSGKSTLLSIVEADGFFCLSADAVCADCYASRDAELYDALEKRFGKAIFGKDGVVDKRKLGSLVFADSAALHDLEALLLPMISAKLTVAADQSRREARDLVLELPLLYEAGLDRLCDKVVALFCDPEIRQARLVGRGYSTEEMAERDRFQLPAAEKLARADFGLINNGSPELLALQWKQFLRQHKTEMNHGMHEHTHQG